MGTSVSAFEKDNSSSVLLIIAHPDDEVMFFSPVLSYLSQNNTNKIVRIVCLSTGNADGFGSTRTKELKKCLSLYNIEMSNVHVFDHPSLQDGMDSDWPVNVICEMVFNTIKLTNPSTVITFDERGVSGHANHISTFRGVERCAQIMKADLLCPVFLKLNSKNVLRKFCGPIDIILAILLRELYVYHHVSPLLAMKGIYTHKSQNVWYRRIFIVLSSFSYVNSFKEIS